VSVLNQHSEDQNPDDDDDQDGPRNVSSIQAPNTADSPRRFHHVSI